MKKVLLIDSLFIIACAIVFSLIDYYGYSNLLSEYAVIVALIAYFIGKYTAKVELRKNKNTAPMNNK